MSVKGIGVSLSFNAEEYLPDSTAKPVFYHATKEIAERVAANVLKDWRVHYTKVELEPDNGWVVVAIPHVHNILDLADHIEVRHPTGVSLTGRPAQFRNYTPPPKAKRRTKAKVTEDDMDTTVVAQWVPGDKKPWEK